MPSRIERAIERARDLATQLPPAPSQMPGAQSKLVAIGDPQASLDKFFAVLDRHALLDDDGRVAPNVTLISIGDHFDFGGAAEADRAAADGLALLSWLAHHDEDRVVLLAGNHDLGRVGELATFDDTAWPQIRAEAVAIYNGGDVDRGAERAFLAKHPSLPTAELAARDFAAFCAPQRTLVTHLLRQHRFHLAYGRGTRLLYIHAGVTAPQLAKLGIDPASGSSVIAAELDRRLFAAIDAWPGPPARLVLPDIHIPGDAASGEGSGILYHRAARDQKVRRYDPRELPRGLVQVIGHVRDKKSRALLGADWCDAAPARDGVIRHLVTDGTRVHYAHGYPPSDDAANATVIFIDGGMNYCAPADYEVFAI